MISGVLKNLESLPMKQQAAEGACASPWAASIKHAGPNWSSDQILGSISPVLGLP
jgi:hypothetical protein